MNICFVAVIDVVDVAIFAAASPWLMPLQTDCSLLIAVVVGNAVAVRCL